VTEFTDVKEPVLDEELMAFDQTRVDLILVEGFKTAGFPKIELHRQDLDKPTLYPNDPNIIAVASDAKLELPQPLLWLDLNRPEQIARFVIERFLPHHD